MSLFIASLFAIMQMQAQDMQPQHANHRLRFVTTIEGDTPVATCDQNFQCHCPIGYRADVASFDGGDAALAVACIPDQTASRQPRETFDSYPVLPTPSNFEQ